MRIGLLGAARITPLAILEPARDLPDVKVVAVAARDPSRAAEFASRHAIPIVAADYASLIARNDIDLLYIALPPTEHERWVEPALQAGRHVLLEKPSAPSAGAAHRMVAAATRHDRRLIEAFHYRYHPLMNRLISLLDSGAIGDVRRIEALIDVPVPRRPDEIRWRADCAGGALMDLGCYAVHWLRTLGGPFEPIEAKATMAPTNVDETVTATVSFATGARGSLSCSMVPHDRGRLTSISIEGSRGSAFVRNPIAPQTGHEFRWRASGDWVTEPQPLTSSYFHQLAQVTHALRSSEALPTEGRDIVENMQAIERIYLAAGVPTPGNR